MDVIDSIPSSCRQSGDYPETGFGEIIGDLLEEDLKGASGSLLRME